MMDVSWEISVIFWLILIVSFAVESTMKSSNIALQRPTRQSSVDNGGTPDKANDGDTSANFQRAMCTHSNTHLNYPWWAVDLGSERRVRSVHIYNRVDGFPERLHDLRVGLMGTWPTTDEPPVVALDVVCATLDGPHPEALVIIPCVANAVGRYLVIQITAKRTTITMCEVEVFGDTVIQKATPSHNIALLRPTKQSSVDYDGTPDKANDGDRTGNFYSTMCTHSNINLNYPWWAVDLESERRVRSVHIYNRVDEHGEKLHDLRVGLMGTWPKTDEPSIVALDTICATLDGPHPEALVIIPCVANAVGRYLVIQITANRTTITMCEVEVFGDSIFQNTPRRVR